MEREEKTATIDTLNSRISRFNEEYKNGIDEEHKGEAIEKIDGLVNDIKDLSDAELERSVNNINRFLNILFEKFEEKYHFAFTEIIYKFETSNKKKLKQKSVVDESVFLNDLRACLDTKDDDYQTTIKNLWDHAQSLDTNLQTNMFYSDVIAVIRKSNQDDYTMALGRAFFKEGTDRDLDNKVPSLGFCLLHFIKAVKIENYRKKLIKQ